MLGEVASDTSRGWRRAATAEARPATPEEHERIWAAALAIWPAWAGYAKRAQRPIPIMVLEPAEPGTHTHGM
jgi:hypothetical protein